MMLAGREPDVPIDFAVLIQTDAQFFEQREKARREDAGPRQPEITTISAVAGIYAAAFSLRDKRNGCRPIDGVSPVPESGHSALSLERVARQPRCLGAQRVDRGVSREEHGAHVGAPEADIGGHLWCLDRPDMRPRRGANTQVPPGPVQKTRPAASTFMPSGTPIFSSDDMSAKIRRRTTVPALSNSSAWMYAANRVLAT